MAQWVPPPLVTGPTRFRVCPELVGRAVPPPLPAAPLPLRKRSTRHPLRLCSGGRGRWMRGPWGRRQHRPPSSARSPRTGARWPTSFCGVTLENTHGGPGCVADSSCPRRRFHRPRLWQFSPVSGLCVSSSLTSRRVGHAGKAGAGGDFLGPLRPKGPCRSLCPLRVGPGAPDATVGTRCLGRWARWPPAKAGVTGCLPLSAGGHRKPRPVPSARTEAPTKLL